MGHDTEFLVQLLAVAVGAPLILFSVRRARDRLRYRRRMIQRDAERLKPLSPPKMMAAEDSHA